MDWKLEVVPIPVSDVQRAKHFYAQQVGFVVDLDTHIDDERRLVQLTPPGSGCSIQLSSGIIDVPPGVLEGLQLVVSDVDAAREELLERGVGVGPVLHMEGGTWVEGRALELVRLLQRSGWQRMDPAGASRRTIADCGADLHS